MGLRVHSLSCRGLNVTGFEVFPAYLCKCVTLISLSANGKYAIPRFVFVSRSQFELS